MNRVCTHYLSRLVIVFSWLFVVTLPLRAAEYDDQGCLDDGISFNQGKGCWVYHDNGANADKPVRVWYYYAQNFSRGSGKVVFAMHGALRNAQSTLRRWRSYADKHGALIIAPEFSKRYYPESQYYNRGNLRDKNGNMRDISDWTYTTIDEIFDEVVRLIPDAPERYSLQGHSAGGQFVHRMALLEKNYRIETAVAANPGWYIVPDENYSYPCGISDLPTQTIDLATAYAGNLVITLGTEDNNPNADMLYHGYCAELQGTNRYDRGRYFYEFARNDASNRNLPFNWKLIEVQGVGHNSTAMVESGANAIFATLTDKNTDTVGEPMRLIPIQDATVKASYSRSNYGSRSKLQVDGNSKKSVYIQFDLQSVSSVEAAFLNVEVIDPSRGAQHVHEAVHNQWNETELNYRNQPGIADFVTSIEGSGIGELLIDITEFVTAHAGEVVTLVISSSDSDGLYFKSTESDSPPILELYQ
jgi:pimeloyl-ACP methyl ester carboxylesterase